MSQPLLAVRDLNVRFSTRDGAVDAVRGLSFHVDAGEVLGIVGESGSGKTQAALALLGLLADNGRATGTALFEGQDLLALSDRQLAMLRGARIALVFQDPMTALNPYLTIAAQMTLVLRRHRGMSGKAALRECEQLLDAVRITDPSRRLAQYPHELSGGMRQRVMIATALLCRPALLIADEATTALDVTVQAQILAMIADLRRDFGTSILLITHDLGIVAGSCDRVLVMQNGVCQEQGPVDDVYHAPRTAYTRALLDAVPALDGPGPAGVAPMDGVAALRVEHLDVQYPVSMPGLIARPRALQALTDASFTVARGEIVGVVGESGCGKSTLARAVLGLVRTSGGRISLLGTQLVGISAEALRQQRCHMQLIFQDPLAALDPRMTIRNIVAEPLGVFEPELTSGEVTDRVAAALRQVGLERSDMNRYPHQFSGGQCQRIGIARALIIRPEIVICDEPVSALDVTVQARITSLLLALQRRLGIAMLFIAHDLAVVRRVSQRVMVMYLGRIVEIAAAGELYESPRHPYTRALLQAVPIPDPRRERKRQRAPLEGEVPSPLDPPSGCAFRTRCAYAIERCAAERPVLRPVGGSSVACHRAGEI